MEELKELRLKLKLTQAEMAEKIGISLNHYGYIERGQKNPSYKLLRKISKTFQVPLLGIQVDDKLIYDINNMKKEDREVIEKVTEALKEKTFSD